MEVSGDGRDYISVFGLRIPVLITLYALHCVQMILNRIGEFSFSFVDDLSVCSDKWLNKRVFLTEIRKNGLTLNDLKRLRRLLYKKYR